MKRVGGITGTMNMQNGLFTSMKGLGFQPYATFFLVSLNTMFKTLTHKTMKIQQPTDNSLYVTIGKYIYYFDDSIDGEVIVKRWRTDDEDGEVTEDIQE